jgi:hypothetical protein
MVSALNLKARLNFANKHVDCEDEIASIDAALVRQATSRRKTLARRLQQVPQAPRASLSGSIHPPPTCNAKSGQRTAAGQVIFDRLRARGVPVIGVRRSPPSALTMIRYA